MFKYKLMLSEHEQFSDKIINIKKFSNTLIVKHWVKVNYLEYEHNNSLYN